jgi:outer membrane cobalamin receptor
VKNKKFIVVSCWLIVVSLSANYQTPEIQYPTFNLSDTVFITASRVESRISNLPISSVLITRNDLAIKSIGDIASALVAENGMNVRSYSIINSASQISLFGSTSQQVLVLLDGLPINSPSVGTPDLGLIPINKLNRIEIVKGPTSSLYGANALGGVINLITEQPFNISKPSYDVNLSYGSYRTSNINLSYKNSIGKYNFIADVHRIQTNGLRTNDDGLMQGIGLCSGYILTPNSNLRLDLQYETKELGLPGPQPNISQIPMYGDSTASTRYDRQNDTLYLAKIIGVWQVEPNLDLNLNAHYTINHSNFLWVDQYSFDTSLYLERYDTKTLNGNIISRYHFCETANTALGIDYAQDWFSAFSKDTSWHPTLSKIGVFSEGSLDLLKNLHALASLRFDWNSGFGTFFSPSLGLIWRINPLLKLRTQLGRAFRAPTLNDLYWPIYGNPNIKPEIGNAYQIGLDYNPNSILSLSTTLFARRTKNLITWSPDSTGFWRPGNVDSSSIFGFEFTGKIKLTDEISFQLSGTLQDAQQIRKEIIYDDWFTGTTEFIYQKRKQTNTPNINFSPSVNIENRLGTNINIYGRYSSSRYNYYTSYDSLPRISMQTKKLPAYFILSLHIAQKLTNLINLKLKIDNLYDVKYSEQFGNSIIDKDYPRPGRIVFIGFEIKN